MELFAQCKKANAAISFYYDALDQIGMESVDDITFTLRVSNADSWDTHATEVFTYAP